nr:NTTRR-F1 domain [Bacillus sp. V2I10]
MNGGFETGTFSPWVASNATITNQFSHSGSFAARLLGGNINSFIFQYVEANPTERFEFLGSLAKVGTLTSPPVSLTVAYYDSSFGFLGYGLITNIPSSRLPNVEDETWLEDL